MRGFKLFAAVLMLAAFASAQELASVEVTKGERKSGVNHWNVKVSLDKPAPTGGVRVSMTSDPESAASVPANVLVPGGAMEASIAVGANPLATEGSIYANYVVTKSAPLPIPLPPNYDEIIDKAIEREHEFVALMKTLHPLVETYVQDLTETKEHDVVPVSDHYFLERLNLSDKGYANSNIFDAKKDRAPLAFLWDYTSLGRHFVPEGFAQMIVLDPDMQKENYTYAYVRTEFVGDIRCMVFDLRPRDGKEGLFEGRIWIEMKGNHITRFNGTYSSNNSKRGVYLHFDSWRSNLQPNLWLPTHVYSEESDGRKTGTGTRLTDSKISPVLYHDLFFKAQVRLWGYDSDPSKHQTEMTEVKVEDDTVQDTQASHDYSPLESERMWMRYAEDNAVDHLEKIGLLAPNGDVDKILQTVANNIIVTNDLDIPEVRCRVLLTTPIESFTIGNTIIMSRGLLDVLPNEGALAAMLAHELAHIALGHRIDTKLAFNDRLFFPDEKTFQRLDFTRNPLDEAAADKKAQELLAKSPYKDQMKDAGLFLEALKDRAPVLTNLISPHFGNPLEQKQSHMFGLRHSTTKVDKMAALTNGAPKLEEKDLKQVAALPLGSRVRMNSWDNTLFLMNAKNMAKLSPQDKMPFEVSPMYVYLQRAE